MNWFKKKEPPSPPVCDHKWQDFPWYVNGVYDERKHTQETVVIEPYVCVHCGERKDVVLYHNTRSATSFDEASKIYNKICDEYAGHIENRAIVEDMISDMQLVDRDYLKYWNIVHNGAEALERIKKGENK